MSIKTLFDKQKQASLPLKKAEVKSVQNYSSEVESSKYTEEYQKSINLYLQDVNFATASNFAKFGSARKYYENTVNRIAGYFPYDGSKASQLEFENNLNPFEKYIYLYEYPRSTGYVNFSPDTWGSQTTSYGYYGMPSTIEYISFYNQNNDNIYSPENGLRENTRFIFSSGSTIEFWMKKNSFANPATQTVAETIFYMTSTGSANKDKGFVIYLITSPSTRPYIYSEYYTNNQGTTKFQFTYDTGLTTIADSQWHHYALTFYSSSAGYTSELYVDGKYVTVQTQPTSIVDFTGSAFCTIGAVGGKINGDTPIIGAGKLSGSIDEFRFWNTRRNAKEIALNYFVPVGGGNNVANITDLGIYFKFNEGITGVSATDSIILDYAGRNCNGSFTGYSSLTRNTGSAITSTQEKPEIGTPILYLNHPGVQAYLTDRLYYADEYDFTNNFALKNSMPKWILDDDEKNGETLVNFLQTISSYLDTLYLQITTYKNLKNKNYLNYEGKAPPFSNLLLTSNGFDLPSLFLNTDIVQNLLNQDSERTYDESINNLKNIIYKNIYNNLNIIYKSKGTENSIKQLIKNFGVNEDVFALNIYANDTQYTLEDTYANKSIKKDYIDFTPFSSSVNATAVIYQDTTDVGSKAFITGTTNSSLSFTAECDVLIPEFPVTYDYLQYQTLTYNTSSVFGIRTANNTSGDTTVIANDPAGLKVRFIYRDDKGYFQLSYPSASITLTSSVFDDITSNQHWNLSVRLTPVSTGSSYNLYFAGYSNYVSDELNSFVVSASIPSASGSAILTNNKRLYVGAERVNVTGAIAYNSLIKALSTRYWSDYLEEEELIDHAKNPNSYGRLNPSQPYSLITSSYVPKSETLLLHWDFTNVTASDSNGNISNVYDLTSGSASGSSYSIAPLNNLVGYVYNGKGYGFAPSSTIKLKDLIYASEQQLPENLYSSQLINILETDDSYYTTAIRPQKYFFAVENSMYDAISKNMLNMFASIIEFNNFIGAPINSYKTQYSKLKFFRKIFFDKVQNSPDLDKYVGIYKWIDDALDSILFNLLPASANASEKVRTIVENHILERNKHFIPLVPRKSIITNDMQQLEDIPAAIFDTNQISLAGTNPIYTPTYNPSRSREIVQPTSKYPVGTAGYSPPTGEAADSYEKPLSRLYTIEDTKRTNLQKATNAPRIGRFK